MDKELQELLRQWEAAEEADSPNYDYKRIAKIFQETTGWIVSIYNDITAFDDNAILRFEKGEEEHFIHIHTSDDPIYSPLNIDLGLFSSQLEVQP